MKNLINMKIEVPSIILDKVINELKIGKVKCDTDKIEHVVCNAKVDDISLISYEKDKALSDVVVTTIRVTSEQYVALMKMSQTINIPVSTFMGKLLTSIYYEPEEFDCCKSENKRINISNQAMNIVMERYDEIESFIFDAMRYVTSLHTFDKMNFTFSKSADAKCDCTFTCRINTHLFNKFKELVSQINEKHEFIYVKPACMLNYAIVKYNDYKKGTNTRVLIRTLNTKYYEDSDLHSRHIHKDEYKMLKTIAGAAPINYAISAIVEKYAHITDDTDIIKLSSPYKEMNFITNSNTKSVAIDTEILDKLKNTDMPLIDYLEGLINIAYKQRFRV